ncbi:transposase (plasmid) [Kovacikia minuta CCNUW1]|uniref:transposase n=1 Tax=Kovacikia minuta TaxID=2931930 RepID=UPI001CCC1985|nr:transposase [Kovacikia minuta]UBF30200.1 transposase [Kovacikia minuta CCNUW1]
MSNQAKKYTPQFKAKVVLELLRGEKTQSEISRVHGVHRSVLTRWQNEFIERSPSVFGEDGADLEVEARIAELEQMVGKLTMQLEPIRKPKDV